MDDGFLGLQGRAQSAGAPLMNASRQSQNAPIPAWRGTGAAGERLARSGLVKCEIISDHHHEPGGS